MPKVIDAGEAVEKKRGLPCEAFFVDTNVVIYYKDPLSLSGTDNSFGKKNTQVTQQIKFFQKSVKTLATPSVALEYYKYLQNAFWKTYTQKNSLISYEQSKWFKNFKENKPDFLEEWQMWISRRFAKVFSEQFPLHTESPEAPALTDFKVDLDFGDVFLAETVLKCPLQKRYIFTDDKDFYAYPKDFTIITTNERLIKRARLDGNLVKF